MQQKKFKKDKEILSDQYNKFSYPNPIKNIDEEIIKLDKIPISDPNLGWHLLWPEKKYKKSGLDILVAGCGTQQAAILARCNLKHKFTGVDLSKNSISYQNKLKEKHNLQNLNLICDDFRNVIFKKKFDYIISTGVLHHLNNPETGLKYFYENLKDDGVIYIMVYGKYQSRSLNEVKKIFKNLNLKQNKESIEIARKIILGLAENHPAKIFVKNTKDIMYDAGIIDLLLHTKEHFFTFENLILLLNKNKLLIKNFFNGNLTSLTKFFHGDFKNIKKIRKLEIEKKLNLSQILNWDDRKIEVILCKKENMKNSFFYKKKNYFELYTYANRSLNYYIGLKSITIEEKIYNKKYEYVFPDKINIEWKLILSGKNKLIDSLKHNSEKIKNSSYDFFENIIENHHLDISYHPIVDHINVLDK